ncbi:hypothetical protein [Hymenobacter glacieicola]|nr:hypothetical protein [Hymenobacter glacieicola]
MMATSPKSTYFRSPHDSCIRRVYKEDGTYYAARTRPGQAEEPPYVIELAYLKNRLIAYGCWVKQMAP